MSTKFEIWDKEKAWHDHGHDEVFIPVDHSQGEYVFRRRWFHTRNCCTFSSFLPDRFPSNRPWKFLTIGVFEGASEVWLMQNILKHPESQLVCIDPWAATTKIKKNYMEECYQNAQHNLSQWASQITLLRGHSQQVMREANEAGNLLEHAMGTFDLVIIDGDHNKDAVIDDAVLTYPFVKKGGWMLFDDVRNQHYKPNHVKHGLDVFLEDYYPDRVDFAWAHRFVDCYVKVAQ